MRYVLFVIAYVALVAWCITDVLQHPSDSPHGLPRYLWVLIIVIAPYVGAAAWLLLKLKGRGPAPESGGRQVPPDDDPEYLRWLREQERRRRDG